MIKVIKILFPQAHGVSPSSEAFSHFAQLPTLYLTNGRKFTDQFLWLNSEVGGNCLKNNTKFGRIKTRLTRDVYSRGPERGVGRKHYFQLEDDKMQLHDFMPWCHSQFFS